MLSLKGIDHNNRGQTLIEFALILPILLLIIFGMVDLGRLIYHQSILNQAAKEAIRMATVGNNLTSVAERMRILIEPLEGELLYSISTGVNDEGQSSTKISFTSNNGKTTIAYLTPHYASSLMVGDSLQLYLKYTFQLVTPIAGLFGNSINLNAVYTSRIEKSPP